MPPRILPPAVVTVSGGVAVVVAMPVRDMRRDIGLEGLHNLLDVADPRGQARLSMREFVGESVDLRVRLADLGREMRERGLHELEQVAVRRLGRLFRHASNVPGPLNVVPQSIETARQNPIRMENRV